MTYPSLIERNVRSTLCNGLHTCHIQKNQFNSFLMNAFILCVLLLVIGGSLLLSFLSKKKKKKVYFNEIEKKNHEESIILEKIDQYKQRIATK